MNAPKYTQEYVDTINREWAQENDRPRWQVAEVERQQLNQSHEQARLMSEAAELRCELRGFRNLQGVEG